MKQSFEGYILTQLHTLELKQRIRLISTSINTYLNKSYAEQIQILKQVKDVFQRNKSFGLSSMIFPDFVEVFGLEEYDVSINALEFFTIDSSSEFAIRHFIVKYEEKSMQQMLAWAKKDNEHIRRLATEGSRPRLPWAISLSRFKKDPTKVFEILEILKNYDSMYVRKSVANNLNDISKDNPKLVISFVKANINKNKNLDWVLKHGSRTLLKQSNMEMLELFGYKNKNITLNYFECAKQVSLGEILEFSFELSSIEPLDKLRIEYSIDLVRKNNKFSNKVFQLSSSTFSGKRKSIIKKHSFKEVSTRNYYEGVHTIYIIVNGKILGEKCFRLIK